MDMRIIITVLGILVGMIILLYGIFSYDKLKKEEKETTDDVKKDELVNEIKSEEKIEKKDLKETKEDIVLNETLENKEIIKEPKKEEKQEISEFINEEDFDSTLVLDNKEEIEGVTEIQEKSKMTADVENLFD